MKILFYASYPTLAIGYSRIGNILSNYLAEQGHDIYYLGISNFKDSYIERPIHPNIKIIDALEEEKKIGTDELYAVNIIPSILDNLKPDLFFIYNDIIVISRIYNKILELNFKINFKTVLYLDLVYEYQKIELVQHVNRFADYFFVFADVWKNNLIKMGIDQNKIGILPHGFDSNKFYPIDREEARKHFGFDKDDFVILNSNRNNYRKSIDKTIEGFILFLINKNFDKRIKLFLNMAFIILPEMDGFDILSLVKTFCAKYNLNYDYIVNNHFFKNPTEEKISDEVLNKLYNACDVGINSCLGEGFGLCNLEHGGIGKPQIVSAVGALKEIFNNNRGTLINPVGHMFMSNRLEFHGGFIEITDPQDFANALVKYFDNPFLRDFHGNSSRNHILKTYNWNSILKSMNDKLLSL